MRAAVSKRPADPTPASDSPLLQPVQVGPWTLANRVVMAPMTRNRAGAGGAPTALNAEYYGQRAGAGCGVDSDQPGRATGTVWRTRKMPRRVSDASTSSVSRPG